MCSFGNSLKAVEWGGLGPRCNWKECIDRCFLEKLREVSESGCNGEREGGLLIAVSVRCDCDKFALSWNTWLPSPQCTAGFWTQHFKFKSGGSTRTWADDNNNVNRLPMTLSYLSTTCLARLCLTCLAPISTEPGTLYFMVFSVSFSMHLTISMFH